MFDRTPLDSWVAAKAGLGILSRDGLHRYQLRKLRQTLRWAQIHSPFYAQRLRGVTEDDIESLSDVEQLPFTTARDLRENAGGFLCVSQSEVSRVVTLKTSGTSGEPKRVYFTAADQELAIDFFHHGMSTLAGPGDRVLIALPHERSGSVGDLLAAGVRRLGAAPVAFGPVVTICDVSSIGSRAGIVVQQASTRQAHRGANGQPFGACRKSGGVPSIGINGSPGCASRRGIECSNPTV